MKHSFSVSLSYYVWIDFRYTHMQQNPVSVYLFIIFCKSRPFQPRKLLATGKKSSPELIVPSDYYWLQLAERPILAVGYSNNSWFLFFCFFEIHILHECLHKPAQYFYYFYLFPSTRLMCTYFRKEKERKLKFKKEWGWNMQHFESLERDKTWKKRERVAVKYSGRKSLPWLLIAKAFGRARKNFVCFFPGKKRKVVRWNEIVDDPLVHVATCTPSRSMPTGFFSFSHFHVLFLNGKVMNWTSFDLCF